MAAQKVRSLRGYNGIAEAEMEGGRFAIRGRLFGWQFKPLVDVALSEIRGVMAFKRLGLVFIAVYLHNGDAYTFRSADPQKWLEAFRQASVEVRPGETGSGWNKWFSMEYQRVVAAAVIGFVVGVMFSTGLLIALLSSCPRR